MRVNALRFAISLLVVFVASGQAPVINNAIRAMTNVARISLDAPAKTLAVRGTAGQLSMSEWLFRWLDRPAGTPLAAARLEYAVAGASHDLVRFVYLANTPTPQDVQEIINAVRSVIEVQRIIACDVRGPLVLRGTAAQIATAEWLAQALDRPPGAGPLPAVSQTLTAPEFAIRGSSVSVARVFYPAHITAPPQLQESINMIRSIAGIPRAVACNRLRAIIVRAAPDEVLLAEWLLNAQARPPTEEAPPLKPPFNSSVTRMFYLKQAATVPGLQELASLIGTRANLQRVASYGGQAIAARGTFEQVAAAERLIREMDAAR